MGLWGSVRAWGSTPRALGGPLGLSQACPRRQPQVLHNGAYPTGCSHVRQNPSPASTSHAGEHVQVERPSEQLGPIHSRRPLSFSSSLLAAAWGGKAADGSRPRYAPGRWRGRAAPLGTRQPSPRPKRHHPWGRWGGHPGLAGEVQGDQKRTKSNGRAWTRPDRQVLRFQRENRGGPLVPRERGSALRGFDSRSLQAVVTPPGSGPSPPRARPRCARPPPAPVRAAGSCAGVAGGTVRPAKACSTGACHQDASMSRARPLTL